MPEYESRWALEGIIAAVDFQTSMIVLDLDLQEYLLKFGVGSEARRQQRLSLHLTREKAEAIVVDLLHGLDLLNPN